MHFAFLVVGKPSVASTPPSTLEFVTSVWYLEENEMDVIWFLDLISGFSHTGNLPVSMNDFTNFNILNLSYWVIASIFLTVLTFEETKYDLTRNQTISQKWEKQKQKNLKLSPEMFPWAYFSVNINNATSDGELKILCCTLTSKKMKNKFDFK